MLSSPEILDSIHDVELRLTEARRRGGNVHRPRGAEVGAGEGKLAEAASENTRRALVVALTRQLTTLWGQYRQGRRA